MPGELEAYWPSFQAPATKGDVISALIGVRSCVVDITIALSASERGDDVTAKNKTADLLESVERLSKLIDVIGGNTDG
jgi:hypothetical protein